MATRTSAQAQSSELSRAMAGTPILARTPRARIEALAEQGSSHSFRKGTYLFHQGDASHDVLFLHAGRIELSSSSESGYRVLHTAIDPPQFFGELGALAEMPRSTSAIVIEDAVVWSVPAATFTAFLEEHAEAAVGLVRALAGQVLAHESLVDDLLFLDLRGRVAKRLLGLVTPRFDVMPPDGSPVPSVVTHADLAALAGGSRENVSRILSDLQRRGIIGRSGKRYVLKDVRALRKLAQL